MIAPEGLVESSVYTILVALALPFIQVLTVAQLCGNRVACRQHVLDTYELHHFQRRVY